MSAWMDLLAAFAIIGICTAATTQEIITIRRLTTHYQHSMRSLLRITIANCNEEEFRFGSTLLRLTSCSAANKPHLDSIAYAEKQ
jgi:hypothetical protein